MLYPTIQTECVPCNSSNLY